MPQESGAHTKPSTLLASVASLCPARARFRLASGKGAKCPRVFGDNVVAAALLDRLLHHAVVIQIEGNSYLSLLNTSSADFGAR